MVINSLGAPAISNPPSRACGLAGMLVVLASAMALCVSPNPSLGIQHTLASGTLPTLAERSLATASPARGKPTLTRAALHGAQSRERARSIQLLAARAAGGDSDDVEPLVPTGKGPYIVLLACLLLYVCNQWARMLPSYLVNFDAPAAAAPARSGRELMNVALGFDAQQYGLLVSYGFSVLYVLFSFPAGIACDVYPRKVLLLGAAAGWSLATAMSAAARSFTHLLAARVLLGIAQAFSGPAAHTLISASFPKRLRATAHSVYTSGIYIGGALASLSVILSRVLGWRATALVVAVAALPPSLLLACTMRGSQGDRARSAGAPHGTADVSSAGNPGAGGAALGVRVRGVLSIASVRWLLAGTAARLFAGFAIGAWTAPYYRSTFPTRAASYSLVNALIVAGGGTVAVIGGGVAADVVSRAGTRPERAALIPAIGSLLAIPFWVVAVRSDHFGVAMGALLAAYLCAESWFGATIAMLQGAVPPAICGTAQGLLNAVQVGSLLPVTYSLPPTSCHLPPVTYFLSPTPYTYFPLPTSYHLHAITGTGSDIGTGSGTGRAHPSPLDLRHAVQVASSLSPPLIGALYRRGVPLRLLLSLAVPGAYVVTAACFVRSAAWRRRERWEATRDGRE